MNIGFSKPSLVHASRQIVNNDLLKPLPVHARGDFEHGANFFAGSVHVLDISVNIAFSKPAPVHARSDFEHGANFFAGSVHVLDISVNIAFSKPAPVHARGDFEHGADMKCSLTNDGPVTIIIDSRIRE